MTHFFYYNISTKKRKKIAESRLFNTKSFAIGKIGRNSCLHEIPASLPYERSVRI